MNTKKIIIFSILFVVVGLAIFFFLNRRTVSTISQQVATSTSVVSTSSTPVLTSTSSVPVFPYDVKYLPDGTLDTSDWQEFKSEYGGFSVKAPKKDSLIGGCAGKGCLPEDESIFKYILAYGGEGVSVDGMNIFAIEKKEGEKLDTWINTHVLSGQEYISFLQKTTVQKYPALQFEIHTPNRYSSVVTSISLYSSENPINMGSSPAISYRYTIVDVGNRYIVIVQTVSIDANALHKENTMVLSLNNPLLPQYFDNKSLTDIYKAILDSIKIISPKKNEKTEVVRPKIDTSNFPNIPTAKPILYNSQGNVDTSTWQEYKVEYGGFSVKAPKNENGAFAIYCDYNDKCGSFSYTIIPEQGEPRMSIYTLNKKEGTTLDTWIDTYIYTNKTLISNIQKTLVKGLPTLQFDVHVPNQYTEVFMGTVFGVGEQASNIGGSPYISYRYHIIDRGDSYLVVSYTTHVDAISLFKKYSNVDSYTYIYNLKEIDPRTFDDKILGDMYKTIFDSLVIFTPTKK